MNSVDRLKLTMAKWVFVSCCCLGAIVWTIILFSDDADPWPDDPDSGAVADVTVHTPYQEAVAASLRDDPIHVDPLLAGTIGKRVDTPEVRKMIEESETAIRIIVVPTQGYGLGDEVQVARVADATGEDGVYLAFDEDGNMEHVVSGMGLDGARLSLYGTAADGATGVVAAVAEVDDRVDLAKDQAKRDRAESPFWLGVTLGVLYGVPLWFLMKFIRWSARRDRSYLKGFRE